MDTKLSNVNPLPLFLRENKKMRKNIYNLLTLFRARSGITLLGQTGQILPKSSLGHINFLNDLLVLRTYSQVNILDFTSP